MSEQKRKCRVCGCDDLHACKGGCTWVDIDLCSQCFDKLTSYQIKERNLKLVDIEDIKEISEAKVIAEEIESNDTAIGFIFGYVEGKGNMAESEVFFDELEYVGKIFVGISIWKNDEPISEYYFDEVHK